VRHHLNGRPEIVSATLLGQNVLVNASGGDVVRPGGGATGEALVVAEVEVGLRAVVGHEHLAMLVWRHRSGIKIEIGIELAQTYLVAARLQQRAESGRCQSFSERRNHAAGDEDIPRHGT